MRDASSSTVKLQSKSNVPARVSQGAPIDYAGKQVHKLAKKLEAGVPLGPKNQKAPSFVKATSHDPWAEPEGARSERVTDRVWSADLAQQSPPARRTIGFPSPSLSRCGPLHALTHTPY